MTHDQVLLMCGKVITASLPDVDQPGPAGVSEPVRTRPLPVITGITDSGHAIIVKRYGHVHHPVPQPGIEPEKIVCS